MTEWDGRPIGAAELQTLALHNYGHFTTVLVKGGRARGLQLHLDRLVRDCRAVFGTALDPEHVRDQIARTVHRDTFDGGSIMVRVTVFDPELNLAEPSGAGPPRVLVTTRPAGPAAALSTPLRLQSRRFRRELPEVKHTGLFGALHARRAAQQAGYDDALFISPGGAVLEGPTWNIGFWDGERVRWPSGDVLPGVTRALLQQVHPGHLTAPFAEDEFRETVAAFVTSAGVGVRPVRSVDGSAAWDPAHPVIAGLRDAYAAVPAEPLD